MFFFFVAIVAVAVVVVVVVVGLRAFWCCGLGGVNVAAPVPMKAADAVVDPHVLLVWTQCGPRAL